MILIDGKHVAADIRNEIAVEVQELESAAKQPPGLALLQVGEDAASQVYVASKDKACKEAGILSTVIRMPASASEREVLTQIDNWNADDSVHGILVQLPLPKHISERKIIERVSPRKDVDGFHPENAGRLVSGIPGFVPCTPAGIVELIRRYDFPTRGKHVVVVGRSNIVGKPIANLMLQKREHADAIVTVCHSAASDISYYTRQADILVAAVGVNALIKSEHVKEGVIVFDVGINRVVDPSKKSGFRLCGDVDFESVAPKCHAITPVPGGIGPMTIAMLLKNTLTAAKAEYLI